MHLVIAVFCMILGISANYGMKFAVPLAYSVFPPMVYFISNRFLSNTAIKKCVVLVAALPLVNTYNLASTVFALPFLLSVFALPIMTVVIAPPSEKRRYIRVCASSYWLVCWCRIL